MVKEQILSVAKTNWNNLRKLDENRWRADWMSIGINRAAICFLDLDGEEVFTDFQQYQEKLLASEFYNNPGEIQWNYYLFIIRDEFQNNIKQEIESNDLFARKYLLSPKDFENFFKLESSQIKSTPEIISKWKIKLDEFGLSEVYKDSSISSAAKNFIEGKKLVSLEETTITEEPIVKDLKKIDRLILNIEYREYPSIRDFHFGSMNLITGTNGAGKTSLLEAIEISICGKSASDPKANIPRNSLLMFADGGDTHFPFDPANHSMYRERDQKWYGNSKERISALYKSFNRFNFFNADAARDFTDSSSEEKTSEALSRLILGSDFSHITSRAERFLAAIKPEYNALKTQIDSFQKIISEHHFKQKNRSKFNSISTLIKVVSDGYEKLRPNNAITFTQKELGTIEAFLNRLVLHLTSLEMSANKIDTISEFNKAKEYIKKEREEFEYFQKQNYLIDQKISSLEIKKSESQLRLNKTLRVHSYLNSEVGFQLNDLSEQIIKVNFELKVVEYIYRVLEGINLEDYKSDKNYKIYRDEMQTSQIQSEKAFQETDKELNSLRKKGTDFGKLISQIKLYGQEILSIDDKIEDCPLCEARYSREELAFRINREITNIEQIDINVSKLINKRRDLEMEVIGITSRISDLEQIKTAFGFIRGNFIEDIQMSLIIESLSSVLNNLNSLRIQKEALDKTSEKVREEGLSETELNQLIFQLSDWTGDDFSLQPFPKESLLTYEKALRTSIANNEKDLLDATYNQIKLNADLINRFPSCAKEENSIAFIIEQLAKRDLELHKQEYAFLGIRNLIELQETRSILDLTDQIKLLKTDLESLKKILRDEALFDSEQQKYDEAKQFTEANSEKMNRLYQAIQILNVLLLDKGKAALQKFFTDNEQLISDIYRTIHSPKEFTSINFNSGEISLIKVDGSTRKVNQISTGQRSALALSLFLALNHQLNNGPKTILFDDPVAFTDDFNVLSFLDFLRFFVLTEGKQIFFATANTKLAAMIEKKFDFLENDFRKIVLER